jgi:hypothetical protein
VKRRLSIFTVAEAAARQAQMTFALKAAVDQSNSESCRKSRDSMESLFGCSLSPSERHHVPHFHAYYQENVAVFSVSPIALVSGSIPQRQQRLIEAISSRFSVANF